MQTTTAAPEGQPLNLLANWISRDQVAGELRVASDTLARWEARHEGPPCTRIGRKVFYRRTSVEAWIRAQEQVPPSRRPGRGADGWQKAGKASEEAMICFDHVTGELMRIRDSRKLDPKYSRANFANSMAAVSGRSKPNASPSDVASITATPGNAILPESVLIADISLEKALNKVKHRHPSAMNFQN